MSGASENGQRGEDLCVLSKELPVTRPLAVRLLLFELLGFPFLGVFKGHLKWKRGSKSLKKPHGLIGGIGLWGTPLKSLNLNDHIRAWKLTGGFSLEQLGPIDPQTTLESAEKRSPEKRLVFVLTNKVPRAAFVALGFGCQHGKYLLFYSVDFDIKKVVREKTLVWDVPGAALNALIFYFQNASATADFAPQPTVSSCD